MRILYISCTYIYNILYIYILYICYIGFYVCVCVHIYRFARINSYILYKYMIIIIFIKKDEKEQITLQIQYLEYKKKNTPSKHVP
jgi:hypothetical protein